MEQVESLKQAGIFHLTCFDKDGNVKWEQDSKNTVLRLGKQLSLNVLLGATAKVTTWHLGLSNDNTALDQDYTLAGEVGTRQATVFTRTGETTTSDAETFTSITDTVRKAFLVSASTSGIVFAVSDLSTPRTLLSTDSLQITYSVTAS